MTNRDKFIALHAQDVRQFPDCYKEAVRKQPEYSGWKLTEGLSDKECGRLLRDLEQERNYILAQSTK